jgi:hypothetical protein
MGWLRKHGRKIKNKLKKFFNTKVGKAIGLIGLGFILPQAWAFLTKSTMPQWGSWYGIGGPKGFFGTGLGKATTGSVSQSASVLPKVKVDPNTLNPQDISKHVINTVNTDVANGSVNIITPNVSSAVTQSIDHTYGIDPAKWETLSTVDQTSIKNLSTPGYNVDATTGIESFRVKPTSDFKNVQDFKTTGIYEGPSVAKEELARESILAVQSGETEAAARSAKKKLLEADPEKWTGVKDFSKNVGEGVVMGALTSALMGGAKEDSSQSLGVIPSPPVTGPSGAFIRDVSSNFVQNGGRPLTFNQYFEMGMPMYGPSTRRNIAVNDRIKTPYSGF